MKKLTRILATAVLVSAFSQPLFAADQDNQSTSSATTTTTTTTPAADSNANAATSTSNAAKTKVMSMSNLLQQLQKAGYTVKSVTLDNGTYKVDVLDKLGEKQSFDVDGAKGLSADQKKTIHSMPIAQVAKKFEKNGASVTAISSDASGYKATVVDKQGNSQDITTDLQGKAAQ